MDVLIDAKYIVDSISAHAFGVFLFLAVLVFFRLTIQDAHKWVSVRTSGAHSITHFLLIFVSYLANREVERIDGESR